MGKTKVEGTAFIAQASPETRVTQLPADRHVNMSDDRQVLICGWSVCPFTCRMTLMRTKLMFFAIIICQDDDPINSNLVRVSLDSGLKPTLDIFSK
jgi:hypothetical protein